MVAIGSPECILAIVLFFLIIWLFKTSNGLPRNWPFLGMSIMLALNTHRLCDIIAKILDRSRGTFLLTGMWFTNMDMLVTSDPKNLHHITITKFSNYPKGSHSSELFDVLGTSLFNLDFEEWAHYRKFMHNFMKSHQFYINKTIVDAVNQGLIPVLDYVSKQGSVVDMNDLFKRHTYDIACFFSTGYKSHNLSIEFPETPFVKAMDDACQATFSRHIFPTLMWKVQRRLGLGQEKKLSDAKKVLQEIMTNYMSMKKQELKNEGSKRTEDGDCCGALKYFLTDSTETHPEQVVRDSVIGLIFASYDTVSSALSWLFWLLSENPQIEGRIRQEIHSFFPGKKWEVNHKEELSKLVYLHAAICETLRLYPAVPFQHRTPIQADILPSGHHVNPKMKIVMSGYASGRMKSIWGEDCEEFRPERWIDGNERIKYEASAKFFIFNAGSRTCPGKELAFTMMKATAASIIYNYHIQVLDQPIPSPSIILQMKHGMRVRVQRLA